MDQQVNIFSELKQKRESEVQAKKET